VRPGRDRSFWWQNRSRRIFKFRPIGLGSSRSSTTPSRAPSRTRGCRGPPPVSTLSTVATFQASRRRWPSGDDGLPAWLAEKDPVGEGYSRRLVPLCIEQRLDVELPHLMRPKNHLYVALVDDLDASFSLACSRAPALKNWLVTQTFLRVTSGRRLAYAACPVTTSLIAKGEKEDASPRS
jgi:hypothetical protein